jgi:hypothetical protein
MATDTLSASRTTGAWRYYFMAAGYESGIVADAHVFYAPDLDTAFRLARSRWPGSQAITCEDSQTEEQYWASNVPDTIPAPPPVW